MILRFLSDRTPRTQTPEYSHSHSQGNPRLIDNLMTDALALGSQMEKKSIDAEVILAAVSNQNLM